MLRNIIIFLFFLITPKCFASVNFDQEKVKDIVRQYITLLQTYSNLPKGKSAIDYKCQLINLFDKEAISGYDYESDLFNKDESDVSFNEYLDFIKDHYENKISVEFTSEYFFGCTAKIKDKEFAFALVNKTLEYIGDKAIDGNKTFFLKTQIRRRSSLTFVTIT